MSMAGAGLALLVTAAAGGGTPPPVLNIVHHRLKRGTPAAYQAVEASIVHGYDRAKVPMFWITFQSITDARDILYLNVADTVEQFNRYADIYQASVPPHPEIVKRQKRLATFIEAQTSTLTTRRDEVAYTRADVGFSTMRALRLATFRVKRGHEGQFMDGVRKAAGGGAPWIVYEAIDESTFVLLSPLRSRAESGRPPPIPRPLRELRGVYRRADIALYALRPSMSRLPANFALAGSRRARSPSE